MRIKDLNDYIFDKISVYKQINIDGIEYETLFNGNLSDIPEEILEMEIRTIGAKRKGIIDIQVQ